MTDFVRDEIERLRWRHPNIIPEFNDLPDALRMELCRIGEQMIDPNFGADAVIKVYEEVRKALNVTPAAAR